MMPSPSIAGKGSVELTVRKNAMDCACGRA
jgi:hypothetical protein